MGLVQEGKDARYWVHSVLTLFQNHQVTTAGKEVRAARVTLRSGWEAGGQRQPAINQTDIIPGSFS